MQDGFAFYDPCVPEGTTPAAPQYLTEEHYHEGPCYAQHGQVRLNDGRCDRHGRFVCGGYNGDEG